MIDEDLCSIEHMKNINSSSNNQMSMEERINQFLDSLDVFIMNPIDK